MDFENDDISLTDNEQKIIDTAIKLLSKYTDMQVSYYTVYYTDKDGEEISSEYDSCDDDECIKITKSHIKISRNAKNLKINENHYDNSGDHENINRCYVCEKPLNQYLSWIWYEFQYYIEEIHANDFNKEEITTEHTAFNLTAIFQSFPSCDHRPSVYAKRERDLGNPGLYDRTIEAGEQLKREVLFIAEYVIETLNTE